MIRWLKRGVLALLILVLIGFCAGWWLLRGSLATLDGQLRLPGLSAPVTIERDALGVVTIHAANELDAMRAIGYVHGQERFFEMDLMRRSAAGELSALIGPATIELDKKHRIHRLRTRVLDNLDAIAGDKLPQLQAYTEGVNAGLNDLKVRPWPYLLLREKPQPWQLADTPLVGYAMYFDLQGGDGERELALWRIKQHVPPTLWALISRDGTRWDAPLEGQPRGDAALPDTATLDLRTLPMPDAVSAKRLAEPMTPGSGNFAVAGALTKDGRAIVADDMHLGLRVPDIWFRARLQYPDQRAVDGKVDISGFTLPGIPGVIVGSNTHVAWGFTNSYAMNAQWRQIPRCTRTPAACGRTARHEIIEVAHGKPKPFDFEETDWGPIMRTLGNGDGLALRWVAQVSGSLNLGLVDLPAIASSGQALARSKAIAIPAQNLLVGDASGHIGWRVTGPLPDLGEGCRANDSAVADAPNGAQLQTRKPPATDMQGANARCPPWRVDGSIAPTILDPSSSRLWTANNRVADGTDLVVLGDGGYALGTRAQQIRDDLFTKNQFTEKDLLAIQLDDRAVFLQRWWKLLQDETTRTKAPALRELATAAAHWDGRADPSSVSYRLVRAWRLEVLSRIRDGLLAPAEAALGNDFIMPSLPQLEGVAWPLVTQRPDNLLPRRFAQCSSSANANTDPCHGATGWDALFEDAAITVRDELSKHGPLAQRRWGERNTAAICHPLAQALPGFFRRWLCMPPDELPGDANMPRVAAPAFGASERMVVSPGHEADGIIEMPGGQSGNPLSPFWGAGHEAWVRGEATPFLPGQTTHTLRLLPAAR